MDKFTLDHLMNYIATSVHERDKPEFTSFAANVLSDPDDLQYYMKERWDKLLDRYYRNTNG